MSKQTKKRAFLMGIAATLCLLLLWAFMPSESPVDYLNRIDQSLGTYVQTKEFGDLKIDLKYKPPAYLAAAQMTKSEGMTQFSYKELTAEFSRFSNYQLHLENIRGGALVKEIAQLGDNYQELVHYLSFGIQEDLLLCTPTDTLNCAFVHFERNYDLAPFTNIEIGFNIEHLSTPLIKEEEWTVQFNADRFGLGPLHFRYQSKEVANAPHFNF